MKTMKFSLLNSIKIFFYINILLFVSLILSALIFAANRRHTPENWGQALALFTLCIALIKHIFKRLFHARRLNYNPQTRIFWVEKWTWFSWRIEHEFAHDELLSICLLEKEGKIWLVNQEEAFCAFLGETSDVRRAKIFCETIAYQTRLDFLSEKTLAVVPFKNGKRKIIWKTK